MKKDKLRAAIEAGLRRLPVARSAYAERDALRDRLLSTDAKLAEATASLEAQNFELEIARILKGTDPALSFDRAILISRALLEAQGLGSGSDVKSSGEVAVFKLVQHPAPVLFDVGGHLGEYTEAFLQAHPSGRAVIFEPSKVHFRILKDRLGRKENVTLVNKGLGERCGEFELYKNAEVSAIASLTKRRLDHFNIAMDKVEHVTVQTLDEALQQHDVAAIDLLKIDVEGHELDVLRGAACAFRDKSIKLVQFEFGGCNLDTRTSLQDFYYFFREHGFTIGLIQPTARIHWLPKYDEFLEHYRTTNFIAAPSSCLPV